MVIVVDSLQDLSGAVVGDPALVARAQVRLEGSSLWPPLAALGQNGLRRLR